MPVPRRSDYRTSLATSEAEKSLVYSIRYEAYRKDGWIDPIANRRFKDAYDDMPGCRSYLVYRRDIPVGSIRACVFDSRRGWGGLPALGPFRREIEREIGLGGSLAEVNRFCTRPGYRERPAMLGHYFNCIVDCAREHGCAHVLAAVRPEHAGFYRRQLLFEQISELKEYPGLRFATVLLYAETGAFLERLRSGRVRMPFCLE